MENVFESTAAPRRQLFGAGIHAVTMQQTVRQILTWIDQPGGPCRYVVTPNVDHVIQLQHHAGLQRAYADASLVLADGWPIVLAARLLGQPLPERVAGSDLVPALFSSQHPLRVFLLGAAPGVAQRAALNIHARWPSVSVVGTVSPRPGFEANRRENDAILSRIEEAQPGLLIVGLGAPKQEVWVQAHHRQISASAALCVGATIDFLAGHRRRAPRWMQRTGLEWFYRMAREPRRLARRYAHDAQVFPRLLWREWRKKRPLGLEP